MPPEEWGALVDGYLGGVMGAFCAANDPAHVLRQIDADLALLDLALVGLRDCHKAAMRNGQPRTFLRAEHAAHARRYLDVIRLVAARYGIREGE